ncbi:MAG: leucine-rich repeat domain-containing protein [Clostridia bacterium]|nr:leucine-rich repeat domain-containing protein [Clostridia bacterium]
MKKIISISIIFAMMISSTFLASCDYLLNGYDPDRKNATTTSVAEETERNGRFGTIGDTGTLSYDTTETGGDATDTETVSPYGSGSTESETGGTGYDGDTERIKWDIDENGVLTLSGTGVMPDYRNGSDTPWYVQKEYIRSAVISPGVTKISSKAFQGFSSLEEVSIPDSVKEIEDAAFSYCSGLKKISVDSNNPNYSSDSYGALYDKRKTTVIRMPASADGSSYTIPDTVKKIGAQAFRGCSGLQDVSLKNGVTEIGDYAFGGCADLETVEIPSTLKVIGDKAFASCTGLKKFTVDEKNPNYSSDADGSLLNKDGSTLLRFPSAVEKDSYVIPVTVSRLGDFSFAYCDGVKSITVPEGIKSIGAYSFLGCSGITEINIPSSVTRIGEHSFDGCSGLKKITVSNANSEYSSDETGALFSKDKTKLYRFPSLNDSTSYSVPESVTAIYAYAFDGNTVLRSLTMPDSVTDIREGAFMNCISLESAALPAGLEKIADQLFAGCVSLKQITVKGKDDSGKDITLPDAAVICVRAFEGCASIETVLIPDGAEKIEANAFAYCSAMTEITIPDSVKYIGTDAFAECGSLKILCSKNSSARKYAGQYGIRYGNA